MNATPKTHAQQVRRAAEARKAVVTDVRRLAYTSETGVVRPQRAHTEHVMSVVDADLAGGVTVGYCECGEYMRFEGQ